MAIPEKKRKQVYEDCVINGLSQREAARKHKIHPQTVKQILEEFAEDERLLLSVRDNKLALKSIQKSTFLLDEAETNQADILKVFIDGLKATSIPVVELKSTKTKYIYKHNGDEKTLVMSEVIEDKREIQSDKTLEYRFKAADRLLTLLTGSSNASDSGVSRQLTKSQETAISIVDQLAQEEDNASQD